MADETFNRHQVIHAIRAFLKYGEDSYSKCHQGYFAHGGFAARVLRFHLKSLQMEGKNQNTQAAQERLEQLIRAEVYNYLQDRGCLARMLAKKIMARVKESEKMTEETFRHSQVIHA